MGESQAEKIRKEFKDKAHGETRRPDDEAGRRAGEEPEDRRGGPDVRKELREQAKDHTRK